MLKTKIAFVILIFSSVILQITNAADHDIEAIKKEFGLRANIVATLASIYTEYEETIKKEGAEASEEVLNRFFEKFNTTFDDSDRKLLDIMLQENGLVKFVMEKAQFHYSMVQTFLKASTQVVETAIVIHSRYLTIRGNLTEAKEVERFHTSSMLLLKGLTDNTLKYLREVAWKDHFKQDITAILQQQSKNDSLLVSIKDMLTDKYPFRVWLVLRASVSLKKYLCHSGLHYETKISRGNKKFEFYVFQTKATENYGGQEDANNVLRTIPTQKSYWTCKDRMETIYDESQYKCSSKRFALFSVIKVDEKEMFDPVLNVKDKMFVSEKVVGRSAWRLFCQHLYRVYLFG